MVSHDDFASEKEGVERFARHDLAAHLHIEKELLQSEHVRRAINAQSMAPIMNFAGVAGGAIDTDERNLMFANLPRFHRPSNWQSMRILIFHKKAIGREGFEEGSAAVRML